MYILIIAIICLVVGFSIAAILNVAKEADRRQEIVVGYDKADGKDMCCLIIAKRIDEHIIVQEEFIGKEAEAVNRALRLFKDNYIYRKKGDSNYEKK